MEDQIRYPNDMGVPAIAITDEEDVKIIQQVINGNYVLVYCSPECLLSTESRRSIFDCQSFKEMLIGVATQSLQTYLFSIDRKDISKLSLSVNTSNCFHPYEGNTLSFLFSMTRQHKSQ